MLNPFDKINPFKSATDVTKQMRLSSVVTPLLWLTFIIVIAATITSFVNFTLAIALIIIAGVVIIIFLISYIKILFFGDPNLLRSEEHIFLMKTLELLGDQDKIIDPDKSIEQNNPALPNPQKSKTLTVDEEIVQPKT